MRGLVTLLVFGLLIGGINAQQSSNVAMLGGWDDESLPIVGGVQYNDVWGYAVGGREFAIIGSREKVHFLEVTDPSNIVEVAAIAGGASSLWRDMKTYQTYAYAVADHPNTNEGLMIFDLGNITGTGNNRVTLANQLTGDFARAHNIFVDEENGILYIANPSTNNNLIVYDLNVDPVNPVMLGAFTLTDRSLHDIYVKDNIAYASLLQNGLYVYDMAPVTAPPAGGSPGVPTELSRLDVYPYSVFNHSSWVKDNILVFADERHGTPLRIADISVINDIQITDDFNSNLLGVANPYSTNNPRGPIAHNPFILGDLCIASYYHDGVVIFDISDPENVINVGHYDTDLTSTTYDGYNGCWGTYPFLPSGRILASDDLNGLFVLEFNAALPVAWGSFIAQEDGDQVRLDWTTTKEEDNAGFTVERALADNQWEAIDQVTPNEKQQYRSYDARPKAGWNTYRIKQTDYDGSSSYSRLATVFWGAENAEWEIYPNPVRANGKLQIAGEDNPTGIWRLFNAEGQTVLTAKTDNDETTTEITLPNLPAGTYWLEHASSRRVRTIVVE